jgi:hypothetical protein
MAKAYGLLPSEVRSRGTLYDIKVTEALVAWEHRIHEEASTGVKQPPKLSVDQMQAMMERVKNEKRKQQHNDAAE